MANRSLRWSILIFVTGLVILLISFRSSLLLGTFGFFVMLFAGLLFERSARHAYSHRPSATPPPGPSPHRSRVLAEELSLIGKRFRSPLAWKALEGSLPVARLRAPCV